MLCFFTRELVASQLLRLPERFQVALQKAAADKVQAAAAEKLQVSTDGSTTPADQIRDITNRGLTADAAKIKATGIGYGSTTTTSAKEMRAIGHYSTTAAASPPPPTVSEPKTSVIQTGAVHSFTHLLSSPCN